MVPFGFRRTFNVSSTIILAAFLIVGLSGCGGEDGDTNVELDVRKDHDPDTVVVADTTVVRDTIQVHEHDTILLDDEKDAPETFEGTVGTTSGKSRQSGTGWSWLTGVTTGKHADYDRVVFEFSPIGTPAFDIEYVDKPVYECGSGDAKFLAGDAWLQVRFHGTNNHTEQGQVSVANRDRKLSMPNLKQLTQICDFEAEVTWVLGLSAPKGYRVLSLNNPPRIVVDVRH